MNKTMKLAMGLSAVLGILCAAQSFAATTASRSINYSLTINPTLTANCPAGFTLTDADAGTDPAAQNLSSACIVTQNRPAATGTTMRITSQDNGGSGGYGVATLSGAGADIVLTVAPATAGAYTNMTYQSGVLSNASGITVNNVARGASQFLLSVDAPAIPSDQIPDTYTGSNTVTFSLL